MYGMFKLIYPSSGISGFYKKNIKIHDIQHSSMETPYLLKDLRSVFALRKH